MKKFWILLLSLTLGCTLAFAQDIPAAIERANEKRTAFEGRFEEIKVSPAGKESVLEGKLEYRQPDAMSMIYDDKQNAFNIVGDSMIIVRNGTRSVYDLTKNVMMRRLRSILMDSMAGRLQKMAEEQDAEMVVKSTKTQHTVTFTPRKKTPGGYSEVQCVYNVNGGQLVQMVMAEWSGQKTTIRLK